MSSSIQHVDCSVIQATELINLSGTTRSIEFLLRLSTPHVYILSSTVAHFNFIVLGDFLALKTPLFLHFRNSLYFTFSCEDFKEQFSQGCNSHSLSLWLQ